MLLAYDAQKNWVHAETAVSDPTTHYWCPDCRQPVFVRGGTRLVRHFAHYRRCTQQAFSEGESPTHIVGKWALHDTLQALGVATQLEAYLPKLQQRPDLLAWDRWQRPVALEYQCSPISSARVLARSQGYWRHGITVLWLLGPRLQLQDTWHEHMRPFVRYHEQLGYYLCAWDSERHTIRVCCHLGVVDKQHLRYEQLTVPLTASQCPLLLGDRVAECCQSPEVTKELVKSRFTAPLQLLPFLRKLQRRKDSVHRHFLNTVYCNRHSLWALPPALFVHGHRHVAWHVPLYVVRYTFLMYVWRQAAQRPYVLWSDLQQAFAQMMRHHPSWLAALPLIAEPVVQTVALTELCAFYKTTGLLATDTSGTQWYVPRCNPFAQHKGRIYVYNESINS